MMKSKGKSQKSYKTEWTIKNVSLKDDKNRTETKSLDIKVGRNSTKWSLKVIFNKEMEALELYLCKKKVNCDNFHINFTVKLGHDDFQWEKKASELDGDSWGWPCLMRLDVLFDESKGYIDTSGRLKIKVEIKLTELDLVSTLLNSSTASQEFSCETCSHYFENAAYSDFTLICEDGTALPVHRVFLAKKSPTFKKMFDTEVHEQKTTLKEINSETMKEVLRYIYCGNANIQDVKLITNVLYAAALYEIEELKILCIDGLMEQINKENVMGILDIAVVFGHEELEKKCLGVILKYYKELKDTEKWNELKMPLIMKIVDAALNTSKHLSSQTL